MIPKIIEDGETGMTILALQENKREGYYLGHSLLKTGANTYHNYGVDIAKARDLTRDERIAALILNRRQFETDLKRLGKILKVYEAHGITIGSDTKQINSIAMGLDTGVSEEQQIPAENDS